MRSTLFASLLLLLGCSTAASRTSEASGEVSDSTVRPSKGGENHGDEQRVLSAVQAFFDVIASRDQQAGARLTVPEGVFVSVRLEDGRRSVRHFSNAEWLEGLGSGTEAYREAFDGEPTVLLEGDVAVVWAPYVFEIDGERSHTGTDAFTLLRTDEGWKVTGGAYTVVR